MHPRACRPRPSTTGNSLCVARCFLPSSGPLLAPLPWQAELLLFFQTQRNITMLLIEDTEAAKVRCVIADAQQRHSALLLCCSAVIPCLRRSQTKGANNSEDETTYAQRVESLERLGDQVQQSCAELQQVRRPCPLSSCGSMCLSPSAPGPLPCSC